jgi:hypothetical protein
LISLTPLRLNLTDEALLADARRRLPLDEAAAAASPTTSAEAAKSVRADEAEAPLADESPASHRTYPR